MVFIKNTMNTGRNYIDRSTGKIIFFGPGEEKEVDNYSNNPGFRIVNKVEKLPELPKIEKPRKVKKKLEE